YKAAKVQVTTVAVGAHGITGHRTLQDIATATGGKYYVVNNPQALPKIYQREARRVARPLIFEPPGGVPTQVVYDHEILKNIDRDSLPPVRGFMMTTKKENPLVEQAIIAPKPTPDGQNSTILATWTYGLGRTAVFTSDAGARWADQWKGWENYDKFFKQLVEWTMRPATDEGKFIVASDIKDGKVRVAVTALDKDDEFLNFLDMGAAVVGPDLEGFAIEVQQVAPGRYEAVFEADKPGGYFVNIIPGPGKSPIPTGVNVPYSDEFRQQATNREFLSTLASATPSGGEKGSLIEGGVSPTQLDRLLDVDTFRGGLPPAFSSRDVWPWILVIAAVAFFADVFVRRVTIGFEWLLPVLAWASVHVLRRGPQQPRDDRLERLRSRKRAVEREIDTRRAAQRFEPEPETAGERELRQVIEEAGAGRPVEPPRPLRDVTLQPDEAEGEDYTTRLLKAKRKAWEERKDKSQGSE
ncbi:MAG: glutamine amidotransferase, partial [Pirellulaceae bacterium]